MRLLGDGPRLALAAGGLSGILYSLSIPKADVSWLAWICFVPCFAAIPSIASGSRPGRNLFLLGLGSGLASGVGRVYWITETLLNYGGLPWPLAVLTNALLVFYLALYPAVFVLAASRFSFHSPVFGWWAACLFVLLEWVQSWLLTGFPWELLGYSQYLNRPLLQLASVTGVYGLSFVILLVNVAVAQLAVCRKRLAVFAGPPALLLIVAFALGYRSLTVSDQQLAHPEARIGIVQGNVPQDIKWKPNRSDVATARYVELTRQLALTDSADLIIFPETALPFWLSDPAHSQHRQQVEELARDISTPLLVGSLGWDGLEGGLYNRGFLLDADGSLRGFTDKVHLVPFGEYLPLPWLFQYMEGLTEESGQFSPGKAHALLDLPGTDLGFGVFICYESIFPDIAREFARAGASFLVNTTNDAWFGRTAAPYQHLSMAVFRAVETGLPLVRVANTGISAIISPTGSVSQATSIFETAAFVVSVQPVTGTTYYVRYGDLFLVACGLALVILIGGRSLGLI